MSMGKRELRRHIYCHRGYWTTSAEQNSLKALSDASANGFGIETDLRDSAGKLVITHDAFSSSALDPSEINLIDTPIALNIKCDGLLRKGLEEIIRLVQDPGSFVFDGSIPEMLQYKRAGVKHALRLSEYEQELSWQTNHIWLDAFQYDWWLEDNTLQRLSENNFVVVVSPELHSREYLNVWDVVAAEISGCNPNVAICTDKPTEFLGIL
jgi:hypothetical protein